MPTFSNTEVLTVSEATQSLKALVEDNYRFIRVRGEISNLRIPYSGHKYFTLKDNAAQIRAVLFKPQERYLNKALADGQQIICHGRISVYEARGEYQLIVDIVEHLGSGELQIRFEQLKTRLAAEGLFDASRKKPLPSFPEKIVLISSPSGAAIHDFLTVWHNRRSSIGIQILPVRVQGKGAGEEIAAALDLANHRLSPDLIILCRGGGSIEDLWAFNEECVAQAICRSNIPVVTGIGHEIDFTIADFCADLRTPTPTGAAERIIPDNIRLKSQITQYRKNLEQTIFRKIAREQRTLDHCLRFLSNLDDALQTFSLRLDLSVQRFSQVVQRTLQQKDQHLRQIMASLERQTPAHKLDILSVQVVHLKNRLIREMQDILKKKEGELAKNAALLDSMSPLATLARGYAIVRKENVDSTSWSVITRSRDVQAGDQVEVLLGEGSLHCQILATN